MKPAKQSWILAGGLVSALAASLCCIGPLAATALGLGTFAAAGWFEVWRPVFLLVTACLLALAWWLLLRARRRDCANDGACASGSARRWPLFLLGGGTLLVGGIALFPAAALTLVDRPQAPLIVASGTSVLRVRIPGMDCAACALGIEGSLRRMPGVRSAVVRYATKEAEVTYDPAVVTGKALVARIDATGFKAEPNK